MPLSLNDSQRALLNTPEHLSRLVAWILQPDNNSRYAHQLRGLLGVGTAWEPKPEAITAVTRYLKNETGRSDMGIVVRLINLYVIHRRGQQR